MTLVSIDLDHFKRINDEWGHDGGDRVLREVGTLLRGRARAVDSVFRLGGEEFLVVLYDTDRFGGATVAEELRRAIESMSALPDHSVTASLGVADLRPGEDWQEWMTRSDRLLYQAKEAGRNRVATE